MSEATSYIKKIKTMLYDVKPSKIHGVGLFSTQVIRKGTVVFDYKYIEGDQVVFIAIKLLLDRGVPTSIIRVLKKWYAHTKTHIQLPKDFDPFTLHVVSLVNHSTRPNLEYSHGKYYAKTNIKGGTELTLNYSLGNYSPFIDF
jgi:hypothetical protein